MGIIDFLKRSSGKTNMMKKLINVMDVTYYDPVKGFNKNVPSKEHVEQVYNEFYNFILNDEILGTILNEHNVTYDMFKYYLNLMQSEGWGWNNGRYIPVDIFSFAKEMKYFLNAIESNEEMYMIYSNIIRKNF